GRVVHAAPAGRSKTPNEGSARRRRRSKASSSMCSFGGRSATRDGRRRATGCSSRVPPPTEHIEDAPLPPWHGARGQQGQQGQLKGRGQGRRRRYNAPSHAAPRKRMERIRNFSIIA